MGLPADRPPYHPKPTAGYPSQRAAVLAMHDDGVDAKTIAATLGIHVNTVRARICSAKAGSKTPGAAGTTAGQTRPLRPQEIRDGRRVTSFELNLDVLRDLRPFAARHGTTVHQVAREIVEAALEQGLVARMLEGRF